VPPDLGRISARCLEKQPGARFQSAADLAFALRALLTGPAGSVATTVRAPGTSIVVLPFSNLSADPEQEYFSDGLTEEVIADLSQVRALRVISRTSAMHYKGTTKPLPTIAQELNVRHVLEGSVRKAGNNLRITAQLIDASTDAHLWAEKYSGTLDDVFDLQEQLSRRIVEALKGALTPEEERRLTARPARDVRAYEAWLRAMHESRKFTKEGVEKALKLLHEAAAAGGENALVHAGLAFVHYVAFDFMISHDDETLRLAESTAVRALELDPNLSQAWLALGLVCYKRGDPLGFARRLKRAVELEPNSDALAWWTLALLECNRYSDAREPSDEAAARDPLSFFPIWCQALVDVAEGHPDQAYQRIRRSIQSTMPDQPFALWWLGQSAAFAGRDTEALIALDQLVALGSEPFSGWGAVLGCALRHDGGGVERTVEAAAMRQVARTDEYIPFYLAMCFAEVGEIDEALSWLEQAIKWGNCATRWYETNRFLAPLRGDPRFEALMDQAREKQRAVVAALA
jgi:TolB-like protein